MFLDPSAFVAGPDLIRALWQRAVSLDCPKDRELFRQGHKPSGLFILHCGDATMTLENDGGVQVASVPMAPGSILGLPALVSGKPYSMTAVAKCGATVGFLTRDDFDALMSAEPSLAFMILQVLAAEVRSTRVALSGSQASPHRGRALKRKRPTPGSRTQTVN